eukprot:CAMPEP_0196574448 /NCGR_PEP_ID=MMETSP1081-20130531/4159_1 /TAXON_ID=36882 /ORGANISM="Pyramimonas amylifera, Strain CCMP720" /LENGTH=399 /DNA_ID=CAMNT_0041892469 /DNA_START=83 /DNA_END=1282 /DNA_ORIENTATION=+
MIPVKAVHMRRANTTIFPGTHSLCLRSSPRVGVLLVPAHRSPHKINKSMCAGKVPRREVLQGSVLLPVMSAVPSSTATEVADGLAEDWRRGENWEWKGQRIRYSVLGKDLPGTPLLLVHGFGASLEHWRFNAPVLAVDRPVYAIDLLGFGYSDKPTIPSGFNSWGGHVWARQLNAFVDEVIQKPVVMVGNSLGGYSSLLATAVADPENVAGLVLVNSAGPLIEENGGMADPFWELAENIEAIDRLAAVEGPVNPLELLKKFGAFLGFLSLRSEKRVLGILGQVYTDSKDNIDEDLATLILGPAWTANSFEVFYRTTIGGKGKPGVSVNRLLETLQDRQTPTALLWGVNDPWIVQAKADRMLTLYPEADFLPVVAGHCPHDEKPDEFNAQLNTWLSARSL